MKDSAGEKQSWKTQTLLSEDGPDSMLVNGSHRKATSAY